MNAQYAALYIHSVCQYFDIVFIIFEQFLDSLEMVDEAINLARYVSHMLSSSNKYGLNLENIQSAFNIIVLHFLELNTNKEKSY